MLLPLLLNKLLSRLVPPRLGGSRVPRPMPGGRGRGAKRINLALQGGGAHGAFTWGVLDHLLADGRLVIDGISGASAGAVNAVMLADGLNRGGASEAQKRLADFWRAVSLGGNLPALQRGAVERMFALLPNERASMPWLGLLPRFWSPYNFNPLNINPLKELIERFVDFAAIRRAGGIDLFVSATNVRTGEPRVFTRAELSADVVMASACVPHLFRAVEIDGVPYWDGGYSGNPAILPFLCATATEDVVLVQINPRECRSTPRSTREIMSRLHEITFNASLVSELRTLGIANALIEEGRLPRGTRAREYRRLRLHRIMMDGTDDVLEVGSKLSTNYEFFELLRKRGRLAAQRFLDVHFHDIGRRSTIDIGTTIPAAVA
jgi:NTE family protein